MQKIESSNSDVEVELLFEHDGCKVYRFFDGGSAKYYTDCRGQVQWDETHGKHHSEEYNQTVQP